MKTDVDEPKTEVKVNEAHLGYIQGVITRMGQNSFQCKAWCITLVSALLVIYLEQPNGKPHPECAYIAGAVVVLFGLLDTYYLYLERGYCYLYNVAAKLITEVSVRPYEMTIPKEKRGLLQYLRAIKSVTTGLFYGCVLGLLLLLVQFVKV